MKTSKRLLCLVLSAVMVAFSLAACSGEGSGSGDNTTTSGSGDPANTDGSNNEDPGKTANDINVDYDDEAIYDEIFGEFYDAYQLAFQADTVSERYALMAIAEAKLLEAGVMMPMQANGGNYAISKVAPYTITPVLWGSDSDRYHNAIVATEPITAADRDALKALYAELKGTGTYEAEAVKYLTEHGYEIQRSYSLGWTSKVETFDAFTTSLQTDSAALVNTYDGLAEYDGENILRPALATSWEESEDGLTWTFHIRKGVKWVDSTGAAIADLTADDFVAGFQHLLDVDGGLSWLVDGLIVGVSEYIDPENENYTEDFSTVGIKATDDYTLVYTLTAPCSYFETMLGYSVFAPLNRAYYESLGGKFGFDNQDAGDYGINKDNIAYCGPYLISSYVENNGVTFVKNESYWNKDNINLDTITWVYNDLQIDTQAYDDFTQGVIDGCGLNAAALKKAKDDGIFDEYAYVSSTDATSFPGFYNLARRAWANFNDEHAVVSDQTQEIVDRTHAAMMNHNFRLALATSMDRAGYLEQTVGADLKLTSLMNSYVPGTFVSLLEETTVSINGTNKTYPAGTFYGQIMQDQITADGYPFKVFDPSADGGIGSSGGYDGWYNPTEAAKYLEAAIEELAAEGIEITAENPIHIDTAYLNDGGVQTARANVVKQSIEENLGGLVIIDLVATTVSAEYQYATFYFASPDGANYDIQFNSGWGPDYGDPSTYLDTMVKGGGYMLKCNGLLV